MRRIPCHTVHMLGYMSCSKRCIVHATWNTAISIALIVRSATMTFSQTHIPYSDDLSGPAATVVRT